MRPVNQFAFAVVEGVLSAVFFLLQYFVEHGRFLYALQLLALCFIGRNQFGGIHISEGLHLLLRQNHLDGRLLLQFVGALQRLDRIQLSESKCGELLFAFCVLKEPSIQSPFALGFDFIILEVDLFQVSFDQLVSAFADSDSSFLFDGR